MSRDTLETIHHSLANLQQSNWFGEQALVPIREINEQYLELLGQLTLTPRGVEPLPFEWLQTFRPLLATLPADTRRRAAQCRFLLVDFHFRDAQWWSAVKPKSATSFWPQPARSLALETARTTLSYVWHTNRMAPHAAQILLGITPAVADILSTLSQHEVARIAERQFSDLRPRWEDQPAIWQRLLWAAHSEERHAWNDVHLQGLQLLATESQP
jgi:hypothetical protein